ncbi:hypothetical protein BLNAU_1726 [Blattamonas nauphoetae]|uniref:B box-type domain-containing protein n=1 Tax=Blattamonas nauphoetae TaxID=2049346 RepID=A0ABQ9YHF4_9EUKA|nr:hypothetical protein BLNAU_1726 [Blattamonas nauphoetae]
MLQYESDSDSDTNPAKQPVLTKCCTKLACLNCIRKWIVDNHFCPHCRKRITQAELVDVRRFVDGIAEEIAPIMETKLKINANCPSHPQQPLNYFCDTCNKPICSDCAILSTEHKGHSIIGVSAMRAKCEEALKASMESVRVRKSDIDAVASLVAEEKKNVSELKSVAVTHMEKRMKEMTELLDNDVETMMHILDDRQNKANQAKQMLEDQINEIDRVLKVASDQTIVAGKDAIISKADNVIARSFSFDDEEERIVLTESYYPTQMQKLPTNAFSLPDHSRFGLRYFNPSQLSAFPLSLSRHLLQPGPSPLHVLVKSLFGDEEAEMKKAEEDGLAVHPHLTTPPFPFPPNRLNSPLTPPYTHFHFSFPHFFTVCSLTGPLFSPTFHLSPFPFRFRCQIFGKPDERNIEQRMGQERERMLGVYLELLEHYPDNLFEPPPEDADPARVYASSLFRKCIHKAEDEVAALFPFDWKVEVLAQPRSVISNEPILEPSRTLPSRPQSFSRGYVSNFQTGTPLGYRNYMSRSDMQKGGYEWSDGSVHFRLSIRRPTYRDEAEEYERMFHGLMMVVREMEKQERQSETSAVEEQKEENVEDAGPDSGEEEEEERRNEEEGEEEEQALAGDEELRLDEEPVQETAQPSDTDQVQSALEELTLSTAESQQSAETGIYSSSEDEKEEEIDDATDLQDEVKNPVSENTPSPTPPTQNTSPLPTYQIINPFSKAPIDPLATPFVGTAP